MKDTIWKHRACFDLFDTIHFAYKITLSSVLKSFLCTVKSKKLNVSTIHILELASHILSAVETLQKNKGQKQGRFGTQKWLRFDLPQDPPKLLWHDCPWAAYLAFSLSRFLSLPETGSVSARGERDKWLQISSSLRYAKISLCDFGQVTYPVS